ncbi:hypothetical protein RclHR1_00290028 [Rhizophagus clarus]|uniref:Kinase-like domain-containing protein n=1 Tax=Rhizophagus clarus TaxID=94130 RepID=A0A2Z6R4I6_9GLOM|nr:hypothetical protein RclHR1_00290028 [Rhizophagus clarus]GET02093.1 kinase-like domain-containing protein [Rhizophagus clarus]
MERCWDSNPANRPSAAKIEEFITSFYNSYRSQDDDEIKRQFQEAEKYKNVNNNSMSTIHPQAIYTSRLLNPYTKDLPEYIDENT